MYALAGQLGLRLSVDSREVTLIWPAAAFALFAVSRYGFWVLPGLALGAILTNNLSAAHPGFVATTGFANPLEAVIGWKLLQRAGFRPALDRLRDITSLIAVAFLAPIVTAFVGATALWQLGVEPGGRHVFLFLTWWLGDGMGILIVFPLLMAWSNNQARALATDFRYSFLAYVLAMLALGYFVFIGERFGAISELLVFVFFPVILIGAARLGVLGAATGLFLTAALAVTGTFLGVGPFSGSGTMRGLLYLHGFLGTLFLSGLAPAALIAERRSSEQKLAASEAMLRSVVMSMAEGVVVHDRMGAIITANPRAESILGLTLDQMSGRTSLDPRWQAVRGDGSPFPGDEHPAMVTLSTGQSCRDVLMGVNKPDDTPVWISINSEPVRSGQPGSGRGPGVPAVVVTFHDITERRQAEATKARADRLESLGTLAGGLAHDLNNVFAPVRLGIDYIAQRVNDAGGRRMLEVMESGIERGAALVGQILSYVRGSSGERKPVSVEALVKAVADWIKRTFPSNLTIIVDMKPGLGAITGDATELNQALSNLCMNARDAMPNGGELRITAEPAVLPIGSDQSHGRAVRISVRDTGPGIPAETQKRIFEPFFTTKTVGTGLGLAMVQSIARGHGGSVEVESKPGVGSTFSLLLPLVRESPAPEAKEPAPALQPGRGEVVLLVEDDSGVRAATSSMLQHCGYKVIEAADGARALELLRTRADEIRVVVSDVSLPGFDGRELLRRILLERPSLPVILVSGLPLEVKDGAFASLSKPYSLSEMQHEIQRALALSGE